jgi:hypothetical protein
LIGTFGQYGPSLWSRVVGVGQVASDWTQSSNLLLWFSALAGLPWPPFSDTRAVGHVDFAAIAGSGVPPAPNCMFGPSLWSRVVGVGHEPISISEMVRTRARGFDRDCPHGVAQGFQITSHKSEPLSC